MANNSDFKKPFTDLFELLPDVFRSQTNESVFNNVFNRYLSKPEIERVNGTIGEATGIAAARQLPEPTPHRQAFQLQPLMFTRIGGENTIASYVDILNELERLGVETCRQPIWGSALSFNWIPPIDIDKVVNFRNYYWVDPINPSAQPQYITIKNPCTQAQQRVAAYQLTLDTYGEEFNIQALDPGADAFVIAGDITQVFVEDFVFFVRESTNVEINNTFFTTVSSTYDDIADQTTIFVVEDFVSAVPVDGVVSIIENMFIFIAEQNCVCGGDVGWDVALWDDNQIGDVLWTAGLLPAISHPTQLAWTIANGPPSVDDIWYDTTNDQLKQYDGVSFVVVQQNFSAIIGIVEGNHFWDFTEGCVVEDNQWIQQNNWIHKNNVINFAAAKQAVQPILEYDAGLQLNKWTCTQYDWGYRESQFIPEFEDVDGEPTLNELIPFVYNITGGSEIILSPTHGDQSSVFVPGYQFRLLGDTSNDGVYTVSTSSFTNDETVINTIEAFVTISDALVPGQTEIDYDGAGSNGVFVGGGGYVALDTIDLADGSTIQVDAVAVGAVTQFTVLQSGSLTVTASNPIPQVSSSGAGLGFILTPESNNIVSNGNVTPHTTSQGDPWRLYDEHWILLEQQEAVPITPRTENPNIAIDPVAPPTPFDIIGPVTVGEYLISDEVDPTAFLGPGTEYIYAMEISLTISGVTAGTEFTFDTRMQQRARTSENDIRVYVDELRQYGQFVEVDTAGFVSGIIFDSDIPLNAIVRIEVGEPALEDIGRESIDVLTTTGIVTQSLIRYRRAEQVKTSVHQYPLFDIVNVDGTDAFMANHIFGYLTSQDAPINNQTGLRIVIGDDGNFTFEQLILQEDNGKMYAFILNGQTQTIWRKGLNDENYIPQYVDADRNPVPIGDPDGFWEIPDQLYFNSEHENRTQVTFAEIFSHFTSIINEQNNIPGFILPGDTFYLQLTPNYGLGGLIKDHNLSYDTMLSSTYIDNVTPLGVIDFAHDAYLNSLNLLKEAYRRDLVDDLLNVSSAYIQDLSGQITETIITQYELNDALAYIYNDSNAYIPATDTGVKNWPATLPFIRMAFKQTPYFVEDTAQDLRFLVHHDGHRSVPELTASTKESVIQTTINTLDTRVNPPEPFGQQSVVPPPPTFGILQVVMTPRAGVYWYRVVGGIRTLYRFNVVAVSDTAPIDVVPGAYWYDTLTDTLRLLSSALTWDPVTTVGDGIIVSAWEEIDLDDILADIWLEVENRLFEAAPDLTELAFDVNTLPSSTVSCPDLDPVTTEEDYYNLYLQEAFGSWLRDQGIIDPFSSENFYDPVDPFTWNYKQSIFIVYPSSGNLGTESGGWWSDLYNTLYLTPYPHIEPWKLQGYSDKPTWWDAQYEDAPVAEVTLVDFTGQTIIGGDHWLLSSPSTDYYVWYDFIAIPEVTNVDFVAHTIVAGDHWLLNGPINSYHVWYRVDAAGVDPAATANPIQVDILSTDTPSQIANKTSAAVESAPDFTTATPSGSTFQITNTVAGDATDASDFNAGVGIIITTQGLDADGTDPAVAGRTGIQVTLTPGDVSGVITTATQLALNALVDFLVPTTYDNIISITNDDPGVTTDAADVSAGVLIDIAVPGAGSRRWIYGHGDTAGGITAAQSEVNYDGAGSNGTFFGGFGGYAIADIITLSDGSTVTVDAEAAGVVTQFTVTTAASSVNKAGSVILQATTTGGGSAFSLTPESNNLTPAGMWENIRVGTVPVGEALPNGVISTGASGEVGLTYTYFSVNIGDVETLDGFDPDDVLPPFWDFATNGGSSVIRSTFETFGQIVNPSADYQFGDAGPVEFEWDQTAQRLYDDLTVSFRMEPVDFIHSTFGEEFIDVAGLNVSPDLCKVYSHKDVRFHGDIINVNELLQFQGLNQWYVNFNRASGFDTTSSNFRPLWQNWSPLLSYQFGSVIDTQTFQIDNPNFDVNARDYRITLKDSVGIENKTYEALNVSVLGIPNRLVSADTESLWTFLVNTLSPTVRSLQYYNVRNYPVRADTLLNTIDFYKFDVVDVNQLGGVFAVAGDQREAFTLSNDFTITNSTGNDGGYTATAVVYDSVLHQTQISVGTPLLDPTADGVLTASYRTVPWQTGDSVQFSTTNTLPSPLRFGVPYYVIRISDTAIQIARTRNDAIAGIFIDIASLGVGQHHVGEINYKFDVAAGHDTRRWSHYVLDRESVLQLTPPSIRRGIQNLINIIDGYAAVEVDEGFVFNSDGTEIDLDLNQPISWQTEIERFLASISTLRAFRDEQGEQFNVNTNPLSNELIFAAEEPTWVTGQSVQILSYDGVVPTPLIQQSPYFVIRNELDRVQLALTRTDALLGNEIDIITGGTGRVFLQEYIPGKRTIESFEINPARNNLWIAHDQGILSNVDVGRTIDIRDTQLITDQNGEKLTTEELAVFRQDKLSRIFVQNSSPDPTKPTAGQDPQRDFRHISTANIFIDGTEHVILFNDDSVEGFLIYDQFLGLNTKYFEVLFFRQDEFTQRPVVGGYFLTQDDELLRNLEASVIDLQQAYDTYQALESTDLVKEGRRSLGYNGAGSQDYLVELNVSPKTQFAFWRGFIQSKGATTGIDAYVNSVTFDGAEVDEYWAFKTARFGSIYEQEYPELNLVEQDAQRTEKRFEFLDLGQERYQADDTFEGVFTTDLDRWHNQPDQFATLDNNQDTLYFEAEVTDVYKFFGAIDGSAISTAANLNGYAVSFRAPRYAATEDITADTFTFTITDPNWKTGKRVRFGGATGSDEPQPINVEQDYFVIRQAPNVVQVAASQDDANNGIPVDIKGTLSFQDETSYNGAGANGTFTGGTGYSAGGIIQNQTHLDYNNVGDNGTFVAGLGYVAGDTITLTQGAGTITVDAIGGGGAITEFTITTSTNASFTGITLFQLVTSGVGAGFTLTTDTNNVKAKDIITMNTGATIQVDQISVGTITEFSVQTSGTGVEAGDILAQQLVVGTGEFTGVGFTMTIDTNNFDTTPFGSPYLFDPAEETPTYFDKVFIYLVDLTTTPETVIDVLIEGVDYTVVNSQLVLFPGGGGNPSGDPALGYSSNGFTPLVLGDQEYRMYVLNPAERKLNPSKVIDVIDDIVIDDVPIWDPRRGHQYTLADNVVTIRTDTDPAIYTDSLDLINVGENPWVEPEVNEVWWDTSSLEHKPYHDKDIFNLENRSQNWGQLSEWAEINLYQWTVSDLPPSEWDAQATVETIDITIDPRLRKSGVAKADTFRRERNVLAINSVNVSNVAVDPNTIFIVDIDGEVSIGDRIVFDTTEELPAPLAIGTFYFVVAADAPGLDRGIQVSLTEGGAVLEIQPGAATVDVNGVAITGTELTGLTNDFDTAGFQDVNLVPDVGLGSNTGLATGTSGDSDVNFTIGISGATATGLSGGGNGSSTVDFAPAVTGGTATGLLGGTFYQTTITIDGIGFFIIRDGVLMPNITGVINQIQGAIGAAGVVILSGGDIVITSSSSGPGSTVLVTDGGFNPLWATMTPPNTLNSPVVPGSTAPTYSFQVSVDGGSNQLVSDTGDNLQTMLEVQNLVNGTISGGVASIAGSAFTITSITTGNNSTVLITDPGGPTGMFSNMTNFSSITAAGGASTNYLFNVAIDTGGIQTISIAGDDAQNYAQLLTLINQSLGSAEASLTGATGDLRITSNSTGPTSTVDIDSPAPVPGPGEILLFSGSGLSQFSAILSPVNGVPATTFTVDIDTGFDTTLVSIIGNQAQTYTELVTGISSQLPAATTNLVDGNIVIASGNNQITISNDNLFINLTDFVQIFNTDTGEGSHSLVPPFQNDWTQLEQVVVTVIPAKDRIGSSVFVSGGVFPNDIAEGDEVNIFVNGAFYQTQTVTGAGTVILNPVEVQDEDFVTVVKPIPALTEEEAAFDPDVFDDGSNLVQRKIDYNFTVRNIVDEFGETVQLYYFWVKDKTTRDPESSNPSLIVAEGELETIPTPYIIHDKLIAQSTQLANGNNQLSGAPWRYSQAIVRGLAGIVNDNERYILRFTRDFTLRDELLTRDYPRDATRATIVGQTEADFNGAGDNGTFLAGTGHAVGDEIVTGDGTTFRVDADAAGLVVAFTIIIQGAGPQLDFGGVVGFSQVSTTGSGINFAHTPDNNNYRADISRVQQEPLDLKNLHAEWTLLREGQPFKITRELWDRITEAVIGRKLNNPAVRVPSLDRELYDTQFNAQTQYGFAAGQAFVSGQLALATTLDDINDPNNDFAPVDINAFLTAADTVTEIGLINFYDDIYNTFSVEDVNRIYFKVLLDALSTKDKYEGLFKTSWVSLEGTQLLQTEALVNG